MIVEDYGWTCTDESWVSPPSSVEFCDHCRSEENLIQIEGVCYCKFCYQNMVEDGSLPYALEV